MGPVPEKSEFSARKSCVTKRLSISDVHEGHQREISLAGVHVLRSPCERLTKFSSLRIQAHVPPQFHREQYSAVVPESYKLSDCPRILINSHDQHEADRAVTRQLWTIERELVSFSRIFTLHLTRCLILNRDFSSYT
jgi:hypothetical protein